MANKHGAESYGANPRKPEIPSFIVQSHGPFFEHRWIKRNDSPTPFDPGKRAAARRQENCEVAISAGVRPSASTFEPSMSQIF
jgi:hypothetical protein